MTRRFGQHDFEGGPNVSFENMAADGSAIIFAEHHVRMSPGGAILGGNVADQG